MDIFVMKNHSTHQIRRNIYKSKMIAKFIALVCLFGLARAGHLYGGSSLGYAVAPSYATYSAPIVTKTIAPVAYAAPAISSVSQYSVHSAPIVKSYAPVSYGYSAPVVGHSYGYAPALSYGGYGGYSGYGSYGYGGYGNKYAW